MKCIEKKDGKQCGAYAMTDSSFCFMHNPATEEQRLKASQDGGRVTYERGLVPLEPIDLTNPKMILYVLADTLNRTRKIDADGTMDIKRANCIANLASKMIEAQKLISIDDRLKKLEEIASLG